MRVSVSEIHCESIRHLRYTVRISVSEIHCESIRHLRYTVRVSVSETLRFSYHDRPDHELELGNVSLLTLVRLHMFSPPQGSLALLKWLVSAVLVTGGCFSRGVTLDCRTVTVRSLKAGVPLLPVGCLFVCWLVGWLHNVPATCEPISGTDLLNFMCRHVDIEAADQTFYFTQSQYTDTGPTDPSPDTKTPAGKPLER